MNRNNELEKLAKKIKDARLKKGISQEKLADICDFDRTYISMLERAKRNPSYLNLLRLSKGLSISLAELLSR
jgi:transcriptional regulator with XRE-family HTH domain